MEFSISVVSLLKVARFETLGAVSTGVVPEMNGAEPGTGEGGCPMDEFLRMLWRRWGRTDAGAGAMVSGEGGGIGDASDSTGKRRDIESDNGDAIGV